MNTDTEILERVRADIADGTSFRYVEASMASGDRRNYSSPLSGERVTKVMKILAAFAGEGGRSTDDALAIIRGLHRYGSAYQFAASLARTIGAQAAADWEDVIRATGPEPGRPSESIHAPEFRYQVRLRLLLNECVDSFAGAVGQGTGTGWALAAIAREEGLTA